MFSRAVDGAKRRGFVLGLILIALVNLFGLRFIWFNSDMWFDLENHDTRVLIHSIRSEQKPLKWFVSDWPLYNGFYRPLPSVAFEIDDRLYGNNLRLYCLTNWFISLACTFGVVWLVYELFRRRGPALGAGLVYASWQTGLVEFLPIETVGACVAILAVAMGAWQRRAWLGIVTAALTLLAARELSNWLDVVDVVSMDFAYRVIGWPVGRTATMLTMFTLPCVAAYCRWERTSRAGWAAVAVFCLLLGAMSYEQVVVVPGLLLGSAIALTIQKVKIRLLWHAIPIAIIAIYAGLHSALLEKTRYYDQAYRGIRGGIRDMFSWLFPASFEIKFLPIFLTADIGPYAILIDRFWLYVTQAASSAISYLSFGRHWLPITYGILASAGAYLPMAFQQPLVHYHHLPMAFRSVFVVWMLILIFEKSRDLLAKPQPFS